MNSNDQNMGKQIAKPVLILFAVCPGAFLSHYSAGLVNIALPEISLALEVSLSAAQWVITGYLLAVMVGLPIMGKVADLYGRKRIHNVGYLVFGLGTLLCGLAYSIGVLLFARIIQGIGAAMLQSANMAIITAHYPKEKRGQALGSIGTAVGLGSMLGPSTGGLLLELFPWSVLFWIQVPILLIVFFLAHRIIPNDQMDKIKQPFDYLGGVLFGVGITSLIFVLNQIGAEREIGNNIPVFIVSATCITLFIQRSRKLEHPFIQFKILKPPMVKAGSLIIVMSYLATFSTMVVLPFYLNGILNVSSGLSGLLLMVYPLLLAVIGPISGRLSDLFGGYKIILFGLGSMVVTLIGLSTLHASTSIVTVAFWLSLLGLAMGMVTTPNYHSIMRYVSSTYLGMISSTIALLRNLGMALGTAFAVTFMNAWVTESVTEWMIDRNQAELTNVLIGFQTFFLFVSGLCLLTMLYLVKQSKDSNRNVKRD